MSAHEFITPGNMDLGKKSVFSRRPTFAIACSLLCLVAFIQLVMVGLALASRAGKTRVVEVVEAGEAKVVYIPTIADPLPEVAIKKVRDYNDLMKAYSNSGGGADNAEYKLVLDTEATPRIIGGVGIRPQQSSDRGRFMAIKNSRVEKLVEESKTLHLSGDVVRAVLKLDEAELLDASEPAIIYRRALIFEDMRNWERAGDEYDKLFELGPGVGAYYEIATDKIANGVKDAPDVVPFQLGNVVRRAGGDDLNAHITIPVRRLADREIEPSQIEVRIFFYDIVDNKRVEAVPQQRSQNIEKRWLSTSANWANKTEESVEAKYTLPELNIADVHLFGERRYFGHVVELYYKGELMDQYAKPGRLHGIHAKDQYKQRSGTEMVPYNMPTDLDGLDSDGMLLPTLKE